MRVLVSTWPFAEKNKVPLEMLRNAGCEIVLNPLRRRFQPGEISEHLIDIDAVIAGTEELSNDAITSANKLKLISRVGIGLDGVDLLAAKDSGVDVCYTPDAPSPAVAELTISMMILLLRKAHIANNMMHNGNWHRFFGKRIAESTIGIIGAGRIGSRVIRRLAAFGSPKVLVNDIEGTKNITDKLKLNWVDKDTIYSESDLISLHVPLTGRTQKMITARELQIMDKGASILNLARGGLIDEGHLFNHLKSNDQFSAGLDVFDQEPYSGDLATLNNVFLTCHMGSMSDDCRSQMEIEATKEVLRYLGGGTFHESSSGVRVFNAAR